MLKYQRLYLDSPILEKPVDGDAGYDLRAYEDILLSSDYPAIINTGIAVEIPSGFVGLVCPRSGLRFHQRISTFGIGVIDSTYRGEIRVMIEQHTVNSTPTVIKAGDKIAQLVIIPYFGEDVEEAELTDTVRGNKGFGSTGK
jgi:dUTP pyrophosphatase